VNKSLFFASLAAAAFLSNAAMSANMGIGTAKSGLGNQVGKSLANVISQKTKVKLRARTFDGPSDYVPAINKGKLSFGVLNELEMLDAFTGTGLYAGRKHPNMMAVTATVPYQAALFVKKDSPITSLKGLRGKRVPSGWSSDRSVEKLIAAQLAYGGMTYTDVIKVPTANLAKGAEDFAAGKTDAFFFMIGANMVADISNKVGGIRALPFDPQPGSMAAAKTVVAQVKSRPVHPALRNVGATGGINVMTLWQTLVAGRHVSIDNVYRVTRTIHDHHNLLTAAFPGWRAFKPEKMAVRFEGMWYHAGAIKFHSEMGVWPPRRDYD
jgi:TRAP transporter TAXI family solute receptor